MRGTGCNQEKPEHHPNHADCGLSDMIAESFTPIVFIEFGFFFKSPGGYRRRFLFRLGIGSLPISEGRGLGTSGYT